MYWSSRILSIQCNRRRYWIWIWLIISRKFLSRLWKKSELGLTVYPSPQIINSIVEPYNSILSTHSLFEHTDIEWYKSRNQLDIDNADMTEFQTNLAPYLLIYFALPCYAQIISAEKAYHVQLYIVVITNSDFEPASIMDKFDPRHDKYLTCCMIYRSMLL